MYGRWWRPADGKAGANARADCPLPWTGDYRDGLGNPISMLAYANPPAIKNERRRGDGYGVAPFDKVNGRVTFECWPRFAKVSDGDGAQFPGWPITVRMADNDGRQPTGWLPLLRFAGGVDQVVQVVAEANDEILYTVRARGATFQPAVYAPGTYTVRVGKDRPDGATLEGLVAGPRATVGERSVKL